MNIDWDEYKDRIIHMSDNGLSSTEIADNLKPDLIKPPSPRSIRSALQRWREEGVIQPKRSPAKILVFDIETSPMISYLWRRTQKFVPENQIIDDWYVICWAAKWLFDDEVMYSVTTPEESKKRDDTRVVAELWDLLNEADIVIAHYGDRFDIRMMNGRFLKYGMNLPMPYKSIDTKKAAGKRMSLPALNLNYIARYLGLPQKHSTNFQLWKDCMHGDADALDRMNEYCKNDVEVLEDVYLQLRPFIQPHPNLGLFIESDTKVCPSCGGTDLKKEGQYQTTVNLYDAFRCGDCASITRSRNTSLSQDEKKTITSSVPR